MPGKDAGAPELTVFTPEQAAKMGAKPLTRRHGSGTIGLRNVASRNLPNGLRTSPFYELSEEEIIEIRKEIAAIGADESIFRFNEGGRTGYVDELDSDQGRHIT